MNRFKLPAIYFFALLFPFFIYGQSNNSETLNSIDDLMDSFAQKNINSNKGFVENKGQIVDQFNKPNSQVRYLLSLNGLNVQLKNNSFSYDTYVKNESNQFQYHRIDIELVNSNLTPNIKSINPSKDCFNFYTAGTHEEGILNVKSYSEVVYENIYNGIDLHFKSYPGKDKAVEYDFIVHPGANASQIKMKYHGALETKLTDGKIKLKLAHGTLSESIPSSFLMENNENIAITYKKSLEDYVAFNIPNYDRTKTLVIDPIPNRDWGTYYGGDGTTEGFTGIVSDASANVYLTGYTNGNTSIATTGAHQTTYAGNPYDAMIVKFNTLGVRQWGTYYGGANQDVGNGIAIDASSNVYITGNTSSTTNISTTGAHQTALSGGTNSDAFLLKLNSNGVRQFSTYYGGINNDDASAIHVRGTNVIFGGVTASTSGIATVGSHLTTLSGGAFIAKFNTTGTQQWATYYQATNIKAVTSDALNNVIVAGNVTSTVTGVTTTGAHQTVFGGGSNDGVIAKFSSTGTRTWATYYGGAGDDFINAVKTNSSNQIIFGGSTSSSSASISFNNNNVYSGGSSDGYISCLDASGNVQWGRYEGSTAVDEIMDIEVRPDNSIYFAGNTSGVIASSGAYQTVNAGGIDNFFGKLDPTNSFATVLWYSNYGGNGAETLGGIVTAGTVLDTKIFMCGRTLSTNSLSSTGAHQTIKGLTFDGFLARFTECGAPGETGTITATSAQLCQNTTYTLSAGAAYNASTYQWVLPTGWSGSSTTNTIVVTTGVTSGFVNVRAVNTCTNSAYVPRGFSFPPLPTNRPAISGPSSGCLGSTQIFTCTNVANATSYVWQLPSGWTGASSTNTISVVVGGTVGTQQIHAAGANGCVNGPFSTIGTGSQNFVVLTVPTQPLSISGNALVCQNSSRTYNIASVPGATSYSWSLPPTWIGSSLSTAITTTIGSASGLISVWAINSCGLSTPSTISVITSSSVPTQPLSILGNTLICSTSTNSYSVNPIANAVNYDWTIPLPSAWSGSSITNTISVTASSASGTIYATAFNGCGYGASQSLAITVVSTPTTPSVISGNGFLCSGVPSTYSVINVASTTYNWQLPLGWSGSSSSHSISVTSNGIAGTLTVTAQNICGTSSQRTFFINSSTAPAQPTLQFGPSSVCQGSTNIIYQVFNDFNADNWTWTLPSGWSGTSTINAITASAGANSGTITVSANNFCGSGAVLNIPVTVNQLPSTPSAITGSNVVCSGSASVYSISPVSGATSYSWFIPGSWSGTSTTNSISTTIGTSSGTIGVSANNACGNSAVQTLSVTVNSVPAQPAVISANAAICQSTNQTYSVTNIAGVTYNWTLPSGWSGSSTTNVINALAGINSGSVTVFASNTCGSSSIQTIAVNVTPNPTQPSVIVGNANVCQTSLQTYSVTNVSGVTYNWILPSGWAGSSSTNLINTTIGASSGNLSVTASNSCATSVVRTFSVTVNAIPALPSAITGNTNTCENTTQSYAVTNISGFTYSWTANNGVVSGSGNNINVTWNTIGTQTLSVSVTNLCGTSSLRTLVVNVNSGTALSQPTAISGNASVCANSAQVYSVAPVSGATSYGWNIPGNWTGTSITNTISVQVGSNSGLVSIAANNSCGSGSSQTLNINVSNIPASPIQLFGDSIICAGTNQTYSVAPVVNTTSYSWNFPSGWSGSSSSNIISIVAGNSSGNISVNAGNSCGTSSLLNYSVTINTVPTTPQPILGNTSGCDGIVGTYSVNAVSGAVNYNWTLPSGWLGSSTSSTITTTLNSTSGIVSVSAQNSCGTSALETLSVTITTIPSTPSAIVGNVNICPGANEIYSVSPVAEASSYNWIVPAGWSGNSLSNSINLTVGTTGGVVEVNATNVCGTSASQSISVIVTTINKLVTVNSNTLSSDQSSAIYQWLDCLTNFSPLSGQNSQDFVLTNSGSYAVEISLNGCVDTSECHNVVITSLANLKRNMTEVTVFPNPNEGLFNIKITNPYATNLKIEMTNSLGQVIFTENYIGVNSVDKEIDLKKFSKGIYFVKISNGYSSVNKRITIN